MQYLQEAECAHWSPIALAVVEAGVGSTEGNWPVGTIVLVEEDLVAGVAQFKGLFLEDTGPNYIDEVIKFIGGRHTMVIHKPRDNTDRGVFYWEIDSKRLYVCHLAKAINP